MRKYEISSISHERFRNFEHFEHSKNCDRFIAEAEDKLTNGRYTCQDFLKVVSHATHKTFDKFCDSKVAENLNEDDENETALTPNDPIEF